MRLAKVVLLIPFLLFPFSLFALSDDALSARLEANNLEIRKAREDYRVALLDVKDARAGRGPTIDMAITGTYMYRPLVGPVTVSTQNLLQQLSDQGVNVSAYSGSPDAYLKLYGGMEHTLYAFSLNITQPVFTWGKISQAIRLYQKIADTRALQITALVRKQRSELFARENAIQHLLKTRELLAEQSETASRLVEIVSSARDNGMLLDGDVLKAQIQTRQIDIGLRQVEMELSTQLLAIQDLCADETITLDDISYELEEKDFNELHDLGEETLILRAVSPQMDNLGILRSLEEVADLATGISQASVNWKPDFALQTSVGYGGSRFPVLEKDWYRQDDYTLNFTVAIKSTVWDGGKKLRDVTRNQTTAEIAKVDYSQAVQKIRNEVSTQYLQMSLDMDKLAYQDMVIESDRTDWEQKKNLSESGYGSETDELKAKLQWQADRLEKQKLLLDRDSCYHALMYLEGK